MSTDLATAEVTRPRHRRLVLAGAVGLVLVVAVVGIVLWRLDGDRTVPYTDPQAAGLLTLCDGGGHRVTEGKVTDRPFAEFVLGETPVGAAYRAEGAVATVFAYQPRAGVDPAEFSGSPISRASEYTDPARPATYVEKGAWSVDDFVTAFPATDDGYVQLRLYLGVPGAGTLTTEPYDTADLRVDGDTWEVVRGGDASCARATAAVAPGTTD